MNGQSERPDDGADIIENAPDPENEKTGPLHTAENGSADEQATLEELRAKADENWDMYLRAAAEIENVRKRAARDVEHARKFALESFAKEMLAVRDSFELGIDAADTADADSLVEGSKATLKLLSSALERFGINELDPVGEPFDPEQHEAMSMQPSADAEPGSVLMVVQKGYSLNGRLLRPAMVIVAAEATDGQGPV
jgi:molecular chaperone GrpE